MGIQYRLLGPVEVHRDGEPTPVRGAMQRMLLTALLLEPHHSLSLDRLTALLWDDSPPRSATANVRTYASRLRGVLGETRMTCVGGGYRLAVHAGELDVTLFAAWVAAARAALAAGDAATAAVRYAAALALWRGPAAADVPRTTRLAALLVALEEQRLCALEEHVHSRLLLGDCHTLVPELRRATATHPTRERLWAALMTALYRCGDPGGALLAYTEAGAAMRHQLGLDPGAELAELHLRMLRRDPDLALRPAH